MREIRAITTSDGEMGVVVSKPDRPGPFPVILSFHHGPGLDQGAQAALDMIADAGYYVIAPDRYYRNGPFVVLDRRTLSSPGADPDALATFRQLVRSTTDEQVERDVQSILRYTDQDPDAARGPRGCIGYCVGARSMLRTIKAHPAAFAAGVAMHPSSCVTPDDDSPHGDVAGFPGRVYVGVGREDTVSSAELNEPLLAAVAELGDRGIAQILDNAGHGFAVPGEEYRPAAAARAYSQAFDMFHAALR